MPTHQSAEQIRKDYFQKKLLTSPSSHSNLSHEISFGKLAPDRHFVDLLPVPGKFISFLIFAGS
jgi:hypothetical protein